ncbi:hypothetical protein FKP32DRAFT_369140 [Trametes sanguinea]|nr:hypothetical protein FKP32DRAFT_369140 [Trametes sanguinea]
MVPCLLAVASVRARRTALHGECSACALSVDNAVRYNVQHEYVTHDVTSVQSMQNRCRNVPDRKQEHTYDQIPHRVISLRQSSALALSNHRKRPYHQVERRERDSKRIPQTYS